MAGKSTSVADRQTSLQVQQSAYGGVLAVQFGTNRTTGNLVWYANFKAIPHTTKSGGKGMGGSSSTDYTYTASTIMTLCEGTIAGIGDVWKDNAKTTLAALGLTLFNGSQTQGVWSFLTGYSTSTNWNIDAPIGLDGYAVTPSFVNQAINYSGTAYLASPAYDLGTGAQIPNHTFEIQGLNIIGGGNPDANPKDIIPAILTAQQYGVGFAAGQVGSLAAYGTYCQAAGLFVSPTYTSQRAAADVIQELCDATNAAPVWSGGVLNIIPYGDTAITGNGTTFTPNLTPAYDLTDDDYSDNGGPPVLITRSTPADAYNRVQVEFKNRANQYNTEVVSVEDQDAIEKYGLKTNSMITMDFVCTSAIAKQMAQLALQRMLYKRNVYEFELNARFAMLEPMDIVTLTDPGLGMTKTPVRIITIEEQDSSFKITAEDLPIGVAAAATYAHDDGVRWTNATDIAPLSVAAPVIFEMPADPSATGLSVGIAAGSQVGDVAYGGCNVWLSLEGTNYQQEGTIWGSSRYGTLSGALAAHASGTDAMNTAHLALRSDGQMISGSAADVAQGTTVIVCDGEYFAYQTATLTGVRAYDLTTLNRGLYGTTGGAHSSGATFVRVDQAIASLSDMDLSMIGQTVYIKLTAFNIYGRAEQELSAVSAYTYTITGNMKALETPVNLALTGNRMPFSQFEGGVVPWFIGYTTGGVTGAVLTTGNYQGSAFIRLDGTASGAGQVASIKSTLFPVTAGEYLALSAGVATELNDTGSLVISFVDSSGAGISGFTLPAVPASSPYNTPRQQIVQAPAGAASAYIEYYLTSVASGAFYGSMTQPSVTSAVARQTLFPAFSPGPNAYGGATVGAPTGTPVGSITAADVSGTINSGGGVAANQVVTASIQASQVTTLTSAYTSSSTTVAVSTTTPTTIQTITFTATGATVKVDFSFTSFMISGGSGPPDYVQVEITRNGTVIFGTVPLISLDNDMWAASLIDTPSTGPVTYNLNAYHYQGLATMTAQNRQLSALETKR